MSENDTQNDTKAPMEMSLEDGKSAQQLAEILAAKAKDKLQIESMQDMHLLKKSKFYYNSKKELREHIATYKGYAILIKQEQIKELENDKETRMFPTLIKINELKFMKKVNGNIVRKIQPQSIHEYEKMALIQGVIAEINKGLDT
jgi:UDP-3-O-[3-hydroxymyristoyl] glucosamine N-acyltransferase